MKRIIFLIALSFSILSITRASESEIILINSSAFVVELDENYDVVRVLEELPNYFSEDATHEELLDAFVSNHSEVIDDSIGEIFPTEPRSKSIVDISTVQKEKKDGFCYQIVDNQRVMLNTEMSSLSFHIQESYIEPKSLGKSFDLHLG